MRLMALALLAVLCAISARADGFRQKVYDASLQLYMLQSDGKTADQICTTTAFQKTSTGYLLLTAAHCVVQDDGITSLLFLRYQPVPDGTLFVEVGDPNNGNDLIPALVQSVGNYHLGWDVAILSIDTKEQLTVMPLGDDTKLSMGDSVVSVSAPLGGSIKYWYQGYVSALRNQIDPTLSSRQPEWRNDVFLQIPGEGGSSGAAIVSPDQQAIVGIYLGHVQANYETVAGSMLTASAIKTFISNPELHTGIIPPHEKKK